VALVATSQNLGDNHWVALVASSQYFGGFHRVALLDFSQHYRGYYWGGTLEDYVVPSFPILFY
jgi:hypothetical protein